MIRARHLNEMLEFAKALQMLPTPQGENVLIVTGAGGQGIVIGCLRRPWATTHVHAARPGSSLPSVHSPPAPPGIRSTSPAASPGDVSQDYQLLYEPRVHALILGYWHTIITPPMTFANLLVDVVGSQAPGHRQTRRGLTRR